VQDRRALTAIEHELRKDDPELARMLETFSCRHHDPVPRYLVLALSAVAVLLVLGWLSGGGDPLLTGAAMVMASTPLAWLVKAARRVSGAAGC
jgi:hypothetical protein